MCSKTNINVFSSVDVYVVVLWRMLQYRVFALDGPIACKKKRKSSTKCCDALLFYFHAVHIVSPYVDLQCL